LRCGEGVRGAVNHGSWIEANTLEKTGVKAEADSPLSTTDAGVPDRPESSLMYDWHGPPRYIGVVGAVVATGAPSRPISGRVNVLGLVA
jgi:hypothetical protein